MKATKIAKQIVLAPAMVIIATSFGIEEIAAKSIARATGSEFANEIGTCSEMWRNAAIDYMTGKAEF